MPRLKTPTRRHYLSKSRFKVGHECPTRLFYLGRPKEYANQSDGDPFLRALADGGFQVGALAQAYYPDGVEVKTLDHDTAVAETAELLKRDRVVIFEAALRFENCFIRVDILEKKGTGYRLLEVKAKSYEPGTEFIGKRGGLLEKWQPYLLDVAYQTWVARRALPKGSHIEPFLFLADKTAHTTVDGLNQRFLVTQDDSGRVQVSRKATLTAKKLGQRILAEVPVTDEVKHVIETMRFGEDETLTFEEWIRTLSDLAASGEKAPPRIKPECKDCPFQVTPGNEALAGLKDGRTECLKELKILTPRTANRPLVWELWDNRRVDPQLAAGVYFLDELSREDLEPKSKSRSSSSHPGLSRVDRQVKQIELATAGAKARPYIDREGIREEMDSWKYPLNFIDFETTRAAIPFNKGQRPYEGLAFQFSHHVMHEDGRVEHKTQYLHRERGQFPNFAFARALREALSQNSGSVFRYTGHENTTLREIRRQLTAVASTLAPKEKKEAVELITWIETLTSPTQEESKGGERPGSRAMIDLFDLVEYYYLSPLMGGSNSLKVVLPSVIAESKFLQAKYSKPFASSLNHKGGKVWLEKDPKTGLWLNPYKQLGPIARDIPDDETLDRLMPHRNLDDGGAAMIAYCKMQFTEMSERERTDLCEALLRYCELDTLAMVMLVEYLKDVGART